MTDTSTAGWYPDPEGRPGLERWWNGLGWSESVRAVGSGATLTAQASRAAPYESDYPVPYGSGDVPAPAPWQPPAAGHPAGGPASVTTSTGRRQVKLGGAAWGWIAGVAALAVILGLVVYSGGSSDDPGLPGGTVAVSSDPTRDPSQTRIVDEAAGVAYPYLGIYWREFVNEVAETTSTAGQYIVTQEVTPDGQFIAQVTSGPLRPEFGYSGPSTFASTLVAVQDSVRNAYYPLPNTIETLRDEAVTIDGAAAYLLEFDLSWDVAGYDSTGERAALLLIETARPAPALIYISIPNTHAELYGVVNQVIASIDVLD